MTGRLISLTLAVLLLATGVAVAQTITPTPTTTTQPATTTTTTDPNAGAYDKLSPGNQKIARALYEAQQQNSSTGTTAGSTSTASKSLSLNDIAAMKQGGQGWGNVFKDMKAQGLVQDRNLGQAVSRYNHQQKAGASGSTGTTVTTAGGRTYTTGKPAGGQDGSAGAGYKDHGRGDNSGRGGQSSSGDSYGNSGRGGSSGHGGGKGK